jgi:hypothetical protein
MADHHHTIFQAIRKHLWDYCKPSSYKVNYRFATVNQLSHIENEYDLILLDRDCTLHGYHAKERVLDFDFVLQKIKGKSEIVSNSSFDEMKRIRDVFGFMIPVNKLVRLSGVPHPCLLRFENGDLKIASYDEEEKRFTADLTGKLNNGDKLLEDITYNFKKPDPMIVKAVIGYNRLIGAIPKEEPRVLMVGDRYLTDIVCGNLAGVQTAIVDPVEPHTEKLGLIAGRYLVDMPVGGLMSRLAKLL